MGEAHANKTLLAVSQAFLPQLWHGRHAHLDGRHSKGELPFRLLLGCAEQLLQRARVDAGVAPRPLHSERLRGRLEGRGLARAQVGTSIVRAAMWGQAAPRQHWL